MACPGTVLRKRARKNGFNGCIHARKAAEKEGKRRSSVLFICRTVWKRAFLKVAKSDRFLAH